MLKWRSLNTIQDHAHEWESYLFWRNLNNTAVGAGIQIHTRWYPLAVWFKFESAQKSLIARSRKDHSMFYGDGCHVIVSEWTEKLVTTNILDRDTSLHSHPNTLLMMLIAISYSKISTPSWACRSNNSPRLKMGIAASGTRNRNPKEVGRVLRNPKGLGFRKELRQIYHL